MDPFLQRVQDRPINGRYILAKKLGEGGFGVVYSGNDIHSGAEVALKLEHRSVAPSILKEEAARYDAFQDVDGFPRVFWFGWHDDFRVMVFELLGPSLEDLFAFCENRFSLKTTLMIADQLLGRLEELHSAGIVHRDIKPRNFLLGSGLNGNIVYITDFGLAEEYIGCGADAEEVTPPLHLVGTARFASIRGHQGLPQSPKDDLESIGYMLVFFMQGKLPWQGLKIRGKGEKEQVVMDMKRDLEAEQLCEGLPQEFSQYLRDVQSLRANDVPDYGKLRRLFQALAKRKYLAYDDIFDWTERAFLELRQSKA